MLSKRAVTICSDRTLGKRLLAGLVAAGATVDRVASVAELPEGPLEADLVVVYVPEDGEAIVRALAARLARPESSSIIAVIPGSDLVRTVKLLEAGSVGAVLVADTLDAPAVAGTASRILFGDVFGVGKTLSWGVRLYTSAVGNYVEKSQAIHAVSAFAAHMGVRRKYRESIEQVADELLMNALYDAPVDEEGRQRFANVPIKERVNVEIPEQAIVQYGCDGRRFVLSVRDSFGSLEPATILAYLDKCLHSLEQIDRKMGGAGLGLYIVANSTTRLCFNLQPGVATEVICVFDLEAPKLQLKELAVYEEQAAEAAEDPAPSAAIVLPPPAPVASGGVTAALGLALLCVMGLIGVVLYPRLAPRGQLLVETDPPGALVALDGRAVGTTAAGPLALRDLDLAKPVLVTATLEGHEPAEARATPDRTSGTPLRLSLVAQPTTVELETDPQGALVLLDGKEAGTTPLRLTTLPPGGEARVIFRKDGYLDVRRVVKAPGPGKQSTVTAQLPVAPSFASVALESEPPGAQVLHNGTLVPGLTTPVANHLVEGGQEHTFSFQLPGHRPAEKTVQVDKGAHGVPVKVTLETGGGVTVRTNLEGALVTIVGIADCNDKPAPLECPVPDGKHKVVITHAREGLRHEREVEVAGGVVVHEVRFGTLRTTSSELALDVPDVGRRLRRAVVPEGTYRVRVVWLKTGSGVDKTVRVTADRTTVVGMED